LVALGATSQVVTTARAARPPKISLWYHAFIHPGWTNIVDEYLAAIVDSGLIGAAGQLNLGIVGPSAGRELLARRVNRHVPTAVVAETDHGWEQVTLGELAARVPRTGSVVYAHTKGVTAPADEAADLWRTTMLRAVVGEWRDRLADLRSYASAGAFLQRGSDDRPPGQAIYRGNFWWARATLVRRLGPPATATPFEAERWLGRVPHRMKDLAVWPTDPDEAVRPT
jgi:hypothetical protein